MDRNVKKNLKYLLLLFLLCALVPHIVLSLLELEPIAESMAPVRSESYANFFVCQWIPFCLALLSYLRLQKHSQFSLLPAIAGTLIIFSFWERFEHRSILTIAWTIPLILIMELSALPKKSTDADREVLRAFFFWALVIPCVALLATNASTWHTPVVSPFLTFPIPAVLLYDVFRRQSQQPLTIRSGIGMLLMMPLSLFLVTVGPMAKFRMYHLSILGIGYFLLLVLLIVYNMDHWKKAKQ